MSAAEVQAFHASAAAAGKAREAARAKEAGEAAVRELAVVEEAAKASGSFGYLATKGVAAAAGSYRKGTTLLLPLKDGTGAVVNLQRIWWERESERWVKTYEKGARRAGTYHAIKGLPGTIAICEGYSTGLSIAEATGWTVLCAMDSGQLMAVAKMARAKAPRATLVVAGDDDWKSDRNVGIEAGKAAADRKSVV
jgi:putative DNA primase/helicase